MPFEKMVDCVFWFLKPLQNMPTIVIFILFNPSYVQKITEETEV